MGSNPVEVLTFSGFSTQLQKLLYHYLSLTCQTLNVLGLCFNFFDDKPRH